jgi:UDP-glucose 4-epimerase
LKALVLGGNGFIGSHVVDQLLAKGHSVRVFDQIMEKFRPRLPGVDYRIAGLDNTPLLSEALEGIDVVFHLISTTVPSTSNKDPVFDIETNLVATVRLLNLIRESSVNRVVFLSSGGTVYGNPNCTPIPESHPLRPLCSYGVVKVAIENYLQMYHQLNGLEYVILRASNPYGERQGHAGVQGVIGTFMERVHTDQVIEIWGDGNVVRDFIYAGDLAELCVLAGNADITGIFNAGSGEGSSINQIVNSLSNVTGRKIDPVYREGRSYDVSSVVLDSTKARAAFGWSPKTGLKDGLDRSWKWVMGSE